MLKACRTITLLIPTWLYRYICYSFGCSSPKPSFCISWPITNIHTLPCLWLHRSERFRSILEGLSSEKENQIKDLKETVSALLLPAWWRPQWAQTLPQRRKPESQTNQTIPCSSLHPPMPWANRPGWETTQEGRRIWRGGTAETARLQLGLLIAGFQAIEIIEAAWGACNILQHALVNFGVYTWPSSLSLSP